MHAWALVWSLSRFTQSRVFITRRCVIRFSTTFTLRGSSRLTPGRMGGSQRHVPSPVRVLRACQPVPGPEMPPPRRVRISASPIPRRLPRVACELASFMSRYASLVSPTCPVSPESPASPSSGASQPEWHVCQPARDAAHPSRASQPECYACRPQQRGCCVAFVLRIAQEPSAKAPKRPSTQVRMRRSRS